MDTFRLPGTGGDDRNRRWFVDFYNQWAGVFTRQKNWYDFVIVHLEVEYSPYKGSAEVQVGLLGFMLVVTYLYDRTFNDEMDRRVAEFERERMASESENQVDRLH